jgi:hypothetical protein
LKLRILMKTMNICSKMMRSRLRGKLQRGKSKRRRRRKIIREGSSKLLEEVSERVNRLSISIMQKEDNIRREVVMQQRIAEIIVKVKEDQDRMLVGLTKEGKGIMIKVNTRISINSLRCIRSRDRETRMMRQVL